MSQLGGWVLDGKDTERGRTRERLGTQRPRTGGPGPPTQSGAAVQQAPACLAEGRPSPTDPGACPHPRDEVGPDEVCRGWGGGMVGTAADQGAAQRVAAGGPRGRAWLAHGRTLPVGTLPLHSAPDKRQEDP